MNNLNNLLSNKNKFILTHPSIIIPQVSYNSTKKIIKCKKRKSNRCCFNGCKKKLKLTDMECRCKKLYCSKHRLPHIHNCSNLNNRKEELKNKIMEGKCVNEKVEKI